MGLSPTCESGSVWAGVFFEPPGSCWGTLGGCAISSLSRTAKARGPSAERFGCCKGDDIVRGTKGMFAFSELPGSTEGCGADAGTAVRSEGAITDGIRPGAWKPNEVTMGTGWPPTQNCAPAGRTRTRAKAP